MRDLDRQTHPTVYEVVVGDRRMPIEGDRPDATGVIGRVRRSMSDGALRRRVRRALMDLFDPRRSALSSSTTLCGIVIDEHATTVRMRLDNGRDVSLMMYDPRKHNGCDGYALGYLEHGDWIWTAQMPLAFLAERVAIGQPLAVRLLGKPA